jgi:hypothetical protein
MYWVVELNDDGTPRDQVVQVILRYDDGREVERERYNEPVRHQYEDLAEAAVQVVELLRVGTPIRLSDDADTLKIDSDAFRAFMTVLNLP